MFKMTALSVALSTAMLASGSVNAATIIFSDITAQFINTQGGSNVTESSRGDPASVRWGTGSDGRSSYSFNAADPSLTYTLPASPTASQALGEFTHSNKVINSGTGIKSTQLSLAANVTIDGNDLGLKYFVFDIKHNETPNTGFNCCSDIVSISPNSAGGSFSYGGFDYTLYVSGFGSRSSNIGSSFESKEDKSTERKLWGYVGAVSAPVPEPSTWAMMIGGLGLVGMTMRRRKASVSFA